MTNTFADVTLSAPVSTLEAADCDLLERCDGQLLHHFPVLVYLLDLHGHTVAEALSKVEEERDTREHSVEHIAAFCGPCMHENGLSPGI